MLKEMIKTGQDDNALVAPCYEIDHMLLSQQVD